MRVQFENKALESLYVSGKCNDKNYRFQPEIVNRFKRCIDYLRIAVRKESLYNFNSLHFEALGGDKDGLFSIRVNLKYRIEFTIDENVEEPTLTICNIIELSNHYK